jgi:protein TonB
MSSTIPTAAAPAINTQVSSTDRLIFTGFVALALHALLIFGVVFDVNKAALMSPPTINVTLATHRDKQAPEQADFLAQHNQQASGTEEKTREITVKKQALIADTQIRDITPPAETQRKQVQVQNQQAINTTGDSRWKVKAEQNQNPENQTDAGQSDSQRKHNAEIASLHAKLDRMRQAYAKRPRTRRLTSVATKAAVDAEYLSKWASKVEFVGNRNYPKQALKQDITGTLRMAVTVKPNGRVERIELLHSSGHKLLDRAAMQIVHMSSPFAPFPEQIKKSTDRLEIIRTWHFEISGLSTSH